MMKKYPRAAVLAIVALFMIFVYQQAMPVYGQSESTVEAKPTTASTSPAPIDDTIKNLKEKIASKVAELSRGNQKIAAGFLVKKDEESLEIKTRDNQSIKVVVDDSVTKFYSLAAGVKKEIAYADFAKDDFILAAGPKIEDVVNANILYQTPNHLVQAGKIIDVDKSQFAVKVITEEKDEYTLDIEKTTKQQVVNTSTLKISPIGFSKLKEGDAIHFVIKTQPTAAEKRASVLRLLVIAQDELLKK